MKFTINPRCPKHYNTQVWLQWRRELPPLWICSACYRPLGAATPGKMEFCGPWPPGRVPIPPELASGVIDWEWSFRAAKARQGDE